MKKLRKISKEYYLRQTVCCWLAFYMLFCFGIPVQVAMADSNPAAGALPSGIIDSSGINTPVISGLNMDITQTAGEAIINWNNFDIGADTGVEFFQPGSAAAVLNRVHDGDVTGIMGSLTANGRVFVINPAGIVFGEGAVVNVSQLVASGLNITDDDFMNGIYKFTGGSGMVSNYGQISAEQVALIGTKVLNAGVIQAPAGTIIMTAGDKVFLGVTGSDVMVEVTSVTMPTESMGDVINQGTIEAASGEVILAAGDTWSRAIDGIGGMTVAVDGGTGKVGQLGTINVDGLDGDAGSITLTAADVVVLSGDSFTTANAGTNGNGGEIIVYSPEMALFLPNAFVEAKGGNERGNGGFFELSGQNYAEVLGDIDLTATNGKKGMLLIDPLNMEIIAGTAGASQWTGSLWEPSSTVSQLGIETLEEYLGLANVTLSTVGTVGPDDGDITFNADRYLNSGVDALGDPADVSLIVKAADDIIFNAGNGINFKGDGHIELYAGPEGSVTSVDRGKTPPNIWTRRGDIIIEAGRGGIDLGVLQTGTPSTSGDERPGEIRLKTINETGLAATGTDYDITVQHLGVSGKGYGSVYAESAGNLTINGTQNLGGAVLVKTVTTADGEDALSFVCLTAAKDVTIAGDVFAEAQGDGESIASVWIGAGTHFQDLTTGYSGTVTVNGNVQADASASGFTKADATIKVYGSVVKLNGNKGAEALGQGSVAYKLGKTDSTDPTYTNPIEGYTESDDAVYVDDNGNPIPNPDPLVDKLGSGSRALVIIDTTKDSSCFECANRIRIILPIAIDDFLLQSKNLAVVISVLVNDQDGLGGALVNGEVFLDGIVNSVNGGDISLNPDGTLSYTPPADWADNFNPATGEYVDYFEYYAVDSDGDVSADPALVTITLINQNPVAVADNYTNSHNLVLDENGASGVILGPGTDSDPDNGGLFDDILTAELLTQATAGTVVLNANGSFTYTPAPGNTSGTDSFEYTLNDNYGGSDTAIVTITLTNQSPIAQPDRYDTEQEVILVIANPDNVITGVIPQINGDTDPDNENPDRIFDDVLTSELVDLPTKGTVIFNNDGTFTYTPFTDESGEDVFTYRITDGFEESFSETTVTITIAPLPPELDPFIPAAPLDKFEIPRIEGCPVLILAVAMELGISRDTIQVAIGNSLALNPSIQACEVCAALIDAAVILRDEDGSRMAAMVQLLNAEAPTDAPFTPEMRASIADAIARHGDDNTYYTPAGQWLDALVEYVGILCTYMGWSLDEAVALVIDKYVAPATEGADANLAAFIEMRLAALAG